MSPRGFRLAATLAGVVALALGAAQSASALTPTVTPRGVLTTNSKPLAIAAGPDGNLWFTENSGDRIGRITPTGTVTEFSAGITAGSSPHGIAAGPDGNLWFTESNGDRIGRITPTGTVTEFSAGITAGSGPSGITAGPDGNLWFTEMSTGKVGKITPAGAIAEFLISTSTSQPQGIVAAGGALWVAEHNTSEVTRVSTSGAVTNHYLTPTATSGPSDIALGGDGNLWFTETGAGRIGRITLGGAVSEYALPSAGSSPVAITAGADGALWFTETAPAAIGRIATDGSVSELPLSSAAAAPEGIVAGPGGDVWFTEFSGNQIEQLTMHPDAATGGTSAVQADGATLAAAANARLQATSSYFEYGPTSAYGATTAAQGLASTGADQNFSSALSGLAPSSTYHYRVVVQNGTGTAFGADQTFTTLPAPPAPPAASTLPLGRSVPLLSPALSSVTAGTPPPVSISGAAIRVTRGRVAPVLVKCPVTALNGCHGTITIALAKGPASASGSRTRAVAARCARGCRPLGESKLSASRGQSKRVPVKLSRYAFHLLALHGKLSVRVTVATVIGGQTRSQSRVVVMRAPRRS